MDKQKKILIADDDKNICEILDMYLSNEGYSLTFCHDGSCALDEIKSNEYDLVMLDVMMPIINGWEVCKIIRKTSSVPVIMITARDMIDDKVQGFELGADDYIVKPFEPREVVARVKARLRQHVGTSCKNDNLIVIGNLSVDLSKYEACISGKKVELKPKELQLLFFLVNNKNIVFSRDQLLEKVWGYDFTGDTRTVDVHVKSLRQKIESPDSGWELVTIWGVGYKFEVK
ncbi:MAG: response regulator transcription factor [Deltaproteobacteria bacterium]